MALTDSLDAFERTLGAVEDRCHKLGPQLITYAIPLQYFTLKRNKFTRINYFTGFGKYQIVSYSADTEYRMVNRYIPNIHGDSIKTKPNCLCHIYLILDHIIKKLSRYLDSSTKNMIPTYHNILFNRYKDMSF